MGDRALSQFGAQQHEGSRLGNVNLRRGLPDGAAIVTGIEAEAKHARILTANVACSGGIPDVAAQLARSFVERGATALVSFGIAGGLSRNLPPGTLLVADRVVTDTDRYPANADWAEMLGARAGAVYGGTVIVSNVAEKARLGVATGALAVDLESGPVACIAAEAGIPFIALRAIADPAWHGLPPAALIPLNAEGRPRLGPVLASITKRPGQIPGLIVTALETRAALNALLRACRVLAVG